VFVITEAVPDDLCGYGFSFAKLVTKSVMIHKKLVQKNGINGLKLVTKSV
jgi:hypothetical protein